MKSTFFSIKHTLHPRRCKRLKPDKSNISRRTILCQIWVYDFLGSDNISFYLPLEKVTKVPKQFHILGPENQIMVHSKDTEGKASIGPIYFCSYFGSLYPVPQLWENRKRFLYYSGNITLTKNRIFFVF